MGDAKELNSRQLGKFLLSAKYIKEHPGKALTLMTAIGAVVVRAEMLFHNESIEYTAISDRFGEVPEGQQTPHYDIGVTEDGNGDILTVVCIKLPN